MAEAYRRTLINDVNKVLKNYTIIYKHLADIRAIGYLKIHVNVPSSGYINASERMDKIDAEIHINNALNVTAVVTVYRRALLQVVSVPFYETLYTDRLLGKSFAFVYLKNATKMVKPLAQNAIGHRQKGDELIYFEHRNVTNNRRFPSRTLEYSGKSNNEYITYVGFSFNSPTAMVLVNTSFVGEQEFNAAVYDMNTEHFVANMSVYGIRSAKRPYQFEGVISGPHYAFQRPGISKFQNQFRN